MLFCPSISLAKILVVKKVWDEVVSLLMMFSLKDLEDVFLQIFSTLPMPDARGLLQQCLSFSTQNVDGCTHLVTVLNTWFQRESHAPHIFNEY